VTAQQRTRKRITDAQGKSSAVCWRRVVGAIVRTRGAVALDRAALVGISGIDASGKGFITQKLAEQLRNGGWNVAVISADDWLNLPAVCINRDNYAEHFYKHAMRFDEMFERLIVPLKQNRGISLGVDCADAKATAFREEHYDFRNVDIILLEGIFLFKPAYRHHFDLMIWIDCSFECAMERAVNRGQEGLSPEETIQAFETIFFPAQRIHLARDCPRDAADIIFTNEKL
jgi:uridine kinase